MITNILIALISLGIWGKASQQTQEKTRKASWLRTALYLVLSVIVGIVFYKTYQVSTNENNVEICKLYGSVDESGQNSDTVQVIITHRFNKDQYKDSLEYEDYVTHGGVSVKVVSRPYGPKAFKRENMVGILDWLGILTETGLLPDSNAITNVFERMYDAYLTNPEMADIVNRWKMKMPVSQKESDLLKMKLDYILSDYRHLVITRYRYSQPTSLLPWVVDDTRGKPHLENGDDKNAFMISLEERVDSTKHKSILHSDIIKNNSNVDWGRLFKSANLQNSIMYTYVFGHSDLCFRDIPDIEKYTMHEEVSRRDLKINSVNFLTAADLSQCIYEVCINSDMPLEVLKIDFDLPVEISAMYPEPDLKSMREIVFYDREKLDLIQHQKIKFHAKFPTLENQQLIRSLILTTILTAIVSLFCSNLYYCLRRASLRYLRRRTIRSGNRYPNLNSVPVSYRRRIICYKHICIAAATGVVLFILYLFVRLLISNPVTFTSSEVAPAIFKTIGAAVGMILLLALANRLLTPRK